MSVEMLEEVLPKEIPVIPNRKTYVTDETLALQHHQIYYFNPLLTDFRLKFQKENRRISITKSFVDKIVDKGILIPVIVNNDLEIIDGQHRYVAGIQAAIDIPFIIIENTDSHTTQMINNTQRKWDNDAYINNAIHTEGEHKEHYVYLNECIKKYQGYIPITGIIKVLEGTITYNYSPNREWFKTLRFRVNNKQVDNYMNLVSETKKTLKTHNQLPIKFAVAIYYLWAHENFDQEVFLSSLTSTINEISFAKYKKEVINSKDLSNIYTKIVNNYNKECRFRNIDEIEDIKEVYEFTNAFDEPEIEICYRPNMELLHKDKCLKTN